MADVRVGLAEISQHFQGLKDPRSPVNQRHPLVSVLMIAIMAILAGSNGPTAIATWARLKAMFLLGVLDLPNGIPCKDVFRCVLQLVNPKAFQACFALWLQSLRAAAAEETGIEQPILAVDGKTARRSHDRANGLGLCTRSVSGPASSGCRWGKSLVPRSPMKSPRSPSC